MSLKLSLINFKLEGRTHELKNHIGAKKVPSFRRTDYRKFKR
jgi:hypothetical protein